MDIESAQVSRLLELAAAMSSAQERVTGNGKLDMAGIMAALSLAQQEEMANKDSSKAGGQNSFLHGKYQKDSTSSLVRAEYVKQTTFSEESETWENKMEDGEDRKKSFLYDKKTVKMFEKVESDNAKSGSNVIGTQMMSKELSDSNIQRETRIKETERNYTRNRNESVMNNNGRKVDVVLKDNKPNMFGTNVAEHKAAFESMSSVSSASSSSSLSSTDNSPPSHKKHAWPTKTGNMKELNNVSGQNKSSLPNLASSQSIASFLTKQQTLNKNGVEGKNINETNKNGNIKEDEDGSENTEKFSGIGSRKSLFERSANAKNKDDKKKSQPVKLECIDNSLVLPANYMENIKTKAEPSLPDLLDSSDAKVSQFLATVSRLAAEKEKRTGNGKLDMAELAGVLSSIQNQGTMTHSGTENKKLDSYSQRINSNMESFDEKKITQRETNIFKSQTVSSSSINSQMVTKEVPSSSLADAKTSFLQSVMTGASCDQSAQKRNNDEGFMQEKNSLISELKNIINDDPAPAPHQPKRSFNAIPKGFQAPDAKQIAEGQVSSSDPMVKKLVYNQYREMLKSYNTNSK